MNIAVLHNYYQHRGGEDAVYEAECALLESRGHAVVRYAVHNEAVSGRSALWLAQASVFNRETYTALQTLFRRKRPDVIHAHNTLPLLSPAVYFAANDAGIPIVQTLHNYRLLCPNALFYRNGRVCEDCSGKRFALDGVRHACYRGSRSASAVVAGMTALHRALGTWSGRVTLYIALTEFARRKFIEGGLPAEKIRVKPNFVEFDAGVGSGVGLDGAPYALFVGRLSAEKGVNTLLQAWQIVEAEQLFDGKLIIVGDGPLESQMREYCRRHDLQRVQMLGRKSLPDVLEFMKEARCLVFPSELYETFGKSMIEAFSCGTPVVCSRLGAMQEVVEDGVTGFHGEASNPNDVAQALVRLWRQNPAEQAAMRRAARQRYETLYTAERNGVMLEAIYREAMR